ncbi:MAG: LysE/ArgO family amino acid transporter [Rhodobacteraceae bacterium]|nr:LysE/ArgO family amino acid transporter [Paracoccaceae bacterium]
MPVVFSDALSGYLLGLSLIVAIGAQNAFVLRQGLLGQHVFAVAATCAISDAILILAGVSGMGVLIRAVPGLDLGMRLFGAAFLVWYGARSLLSAWRGGQALQAEGSAPSLNTALVTCLALTWLNPHVYLDTLVLLGSISSQYAHPFGFGFGAVIASLTFFFALGYGAQILTPVFARPAAWRVLELVIGLVMWSIAFSLVR